MVILGMWLRPHHYLALGLQRLLIYTRAPHPPLWKRSFPNEWWRLWMKDKEKYLVRIHEYTRCGARRGPIWSGHAAHFQYLSLSWKWNSAPSFDAPNTFISRRVDTLPRRALDCLVRTTSLLTERSKIPKVSTTELRGFPGQYWYRINYGAVNTVHVFKANILLYLIKLSISISQYVHS